MRSRKLIRSYGWVKIYIPWIQIWIKITADRKIDPNVWRTRCLPEGVSWHDMWQSIEYDQDECRLYLRDWLKKNISGQYQFVTNTDIMIFQKESDVSFFILVWGANGNKTSPLA